MRNAQSNHTVNSVIFLLLCCCNYFHQHCEAVQLEQNLDLYVEPYTFNVTKRQNFCGLQAKVDADEVDLRTVLSGKYLNIAIMPGKYENTDDNGNFADSTDLGLSLKIFNEIATRGNFTWKDSYIVQDDPPEGKDWTDLLLWSIETYDVSVDWWIPNSIRIANGATFIKGWLDASTIIVSKVTSSSDETESEFSFFNWGTPFTSSVWIAIVGTVLITALVSLFVEGLSGIYVPVQGNIFSAFGSYVHHCLLVLSGHLDHIPLSHAGQIMSFSIAFFAMLLLAAYTANLASFLVIEKAAANTLVDTVNDIVKSGNSICVQNGAATQKAVQNTYDSVILVKKSNDEESLLALGKGECDYAVMPLSNFESSRIKKEINGDCNLKRIGQTFKVEEAGFATYSDAGVLCTSMIRDVLNVHMQDLHDEGWIEEAWNDYYEKIQDINDPKCFDDTSSVTKESEETLDLVNVGGIFLFHGSLVCFAILLFVGEMLLARRNRIDVDGSDTRPDKLPISVSDMRKAHFAEKTKVKTGMNAAMRESAVLRMSGMNGSLRMNSFEEISTEVSQMRVDLDNVTQKVDHLTHLLTQALQNGIPKDSFKDDYVVTEV